ncbi:hypothetical protein GGS26DRAFT_550750 [Hypomontagnella submonticulosa]|nr:hypothetical protein GGS26DRAFT_550750 [Hypomontagnella submonticulosa]
METPASTQKTDGGVEPSIEDMVLEHLGKYLQSEGQAQSHPTNGSQGSLPSSSSQVEQQGQREPKRNEAQDNKGNGGATYTRDDFWNTPGVDWTQVQLSKDEKSGSTTGGIESMQTGPECYTCGTRLNFEQIAGMEPCSVCFSYN